MQFRPMIIEGTGVALPASCVTSADLDQRLGKEPGWLQRATGIRQRHVATSESQVDLGLAAARMAIAQAGCSVDEIDLVLFSAAVPYQPIPSTAPLIQRGLGIADGKAAAFDINATCLGFLTALDLAASMLAAGTHRRALIVASELASRGLPWESDPATAGLFGDGAAAAVVSAGTVGNAGIVASSMETWPQAYEACQIGAGGTRFDFASERQAFEANALFSMDGEALYKVTIRHFGPFLDRLLDRAGWRREDVDIVIPHQASPGALAHLARRSGFAGDKVVNIIADTGNQIAASIPTALHRARQAGRLTPGTRALLLGTSAGVSFGGMALVV